MEVFLPSSGLLEKKKQKSGKSSRLFRGLFFQLNCQLSGCFICDENFFGVLGSGFHNMLDVRTYRSAAVKPSAKRPAQELLQ